MFKVVLLVLNFVLPVMAKGTELQYDDNGIAFLKAGAGQVKLVETFFGEIIPNQNRLAILNPRYAGVVRSVRVSIGDHVKKGQLLAKLDRNVGLRSFEMKANIAGQVIQRQVSKGEFVNEELSAFVIADLSTVWVRITGKRDQKVFLKENTDVGVKSLDGSTTGNAKLHYVSRLLDEKMLRLTAYGELDNFNNKWLPGQYVNVNLVRGQREFPLVVPLSAVAKDEWGSFYVYTLEKGKSFLKTKVKIGAQGLENVSILHGLSQKDDVAFDAIEVLEMRREDPTKDEHDNHKNHDDHDDHSDHEDSHD